MGAGPRGLAVLERICSNAAASGAPDLPLTVHLVDPQGPGGAVWRTRQPTQLLMNTVASQVTVFTDASVEIRGPIVPGPSLYEWAKTEVLGGPQAAHPSWVRVEASQLTGDTYPTRAFYGHYLGWVFQHLVLTAPAWVSIVQHRATAVTLDDGPDGGQSLRLDDGRELTGLDAVVLAQGHLPMPLGTAEQRLGAHAAREGLTYLPPANPADADLSAVLPGRRVGLRGLGLNFFDYLGLLTTGRGGSFEHVRGRLVYRPSGAEPMLYAGSRRGLPFHARGDNQKGVSGRHTPLLLTPRVIAGLLERHRVHGGLEFTADLWPLVDLEVQAVYYGALIASRHGHRAGQAFLQDFAALAADITAGSPAGHGPLDLLLARHRIADADRWDWALIERPWGDRPFTGPADFRGWLLKHLEADVREAARGNALGPLKAALDVLRDLRNELRILVDHGGITGRSYQDELNGWYTPLNAFLSIGPPRRRIEETAALVEAGVLNLVGPGLTVAETSGGFLLTSRVVPSSEVRVDALIEARLPESDIRRTTDPLIGHLLATGQCRAYAIPTPGESDLQTGGLAVTRAPYRLVDAQGRPHPSRYAFGVPTEAVHWVTAAGVRPGVNSVILSDADAIAHAVLPGRATRAGELATHSGGVR
ncbi:FAD/NAD(P)-binding protein [Kitasatospora sp. NBC_01560]|uniref:FAD/NAD(P)-binding protein n=1 Tax=Kitasatospora sp. NBC_01560 TaxID=2975965 RepID=UPI003863C55C